MSVTVTPDHEIYLDNGIGWTEAKNVVVGDLAVTRYPSRMNGTFGEFMRGVLSGDSHLNKARHHINASLKISDNIDPLYAAWKVSKLKALNFKPLLVKAKTRMLYGSEYSTELAYLKDEFKCRDPMILLSNFSWLGFAVWLMDDAVYDRSRYTLSIKRFKGNYDKISEISQALDDLDLYHHASNGGRIVFDKSVSDMIANNVSKYIPECMRRKLPENLWGQYQDFELSSVVEMKSATARVINVRDIASSRQMKETGKYDITVGGFQCYLAGGKHNGILVHNSPDTTSGGLALKFFASIRIQINKGSPINGSKKDVILGFRPTVKIIKNKCARPFTSAEFDICVGHPEHPICGIDEISSLVEVGESYGVLTKKSSHYAFEGQNIGNGLANAAAFVREHPEVQDKLREKIYGSLTLAAQVPSDDSDEELADDILDNVTDGDE